MCTITVVITCPLWLKIPMSINVFELFKQHVFLTIFFKSIFIMNYSGLSYPESKIELTLLCTFNIITMLA